jgi:uncharacterized membrane protein YfcA
VRERLSNLRVAMLLEVTTASGGIAGAYLAGLLPERWLFLIFGAMLAYTAYAMARSKSSDEGTAVQPDALAQKLQLQGEYFDPAIHRTVAYSVRRTKIGMAFSGLAGILSGLLGIGGGAVKVPTMHLIMGMPMKASTATSNFMMGVTAAASAGVYFARGDVDPFIAAPVAVGVLVGAKTGSHLLGRIQSARVRWLFIGVIAVIAVQMLRKGMQ